MMVSTIGDHIQSSIQKQNYYYYQSSYLGRKQVEKFQTRNLHSAFLFVCSCFIEPATRAHRGDRGKSSLSRSDRC